MASISGGMPDVIVRTCSVTRRSASPTAPRSARVALAAARAGVLGRD
ncbi:hypothetical protein ACQPW3_33110 [Actinosynnema sp. CA-248983]